MTLNSVPKEIALNGGMDIKQSSELQDETTLRAVTNLRWNALGELEKRPTYASDAAVSAETGSDYTDMTPEALFTRGSEVFALTKNGGLVSVDPADHDAALWPGDPIGYLPRACRVSRRFVERSQFGRDGTFILQVASALYGNDLVIAWVEATSTPVYSLNVKAIDVNTGQVVMPPSPISLSGSLITISLAATTCNIAGSEGVIFTISRSAVAPYQIDYVHYAAATRTVSNAALTTNAKVPTSAIADAGDNATFYFAFTDNTSGFLTCQQRTLSTISSTHTGTLANPAHHALVVHASSTLILTTTSSNVCAERFGSPANRITVFTASSETFGPVTASLEATADQEAIVYVNATTSGVTPTAYYVRTARVTFSSSTPVLGDTVRVPWCWAVNKAVSIGDRSYVALAVPSAENTTAFLCRYNETTTYSLVEMNAVARLGHDRFSPFLSGFVGAVNSISVASNKVHMVFMADPSEAGVVGSAKAPQSLFHATVEFAADGEALPLPSVEVDGTTLIASGMPLEWDGSDMSEHQPIHAPIVVLDVSGGTGQTGTFSVIAIYRWVDAKGRLHRSAPSAAVSTGALVNKEIKVYVSKPLFYSYDDSQSMEAEVYITADGGSTYWLALDASAKEFAGATSSDLWWIFDTVKAGTSDGPQLYTTGAPGEELAAEAPPAFMSICRLADRLWAIDAEERSRVWFTKPLVVGFAPEWNTTNTLPIGDDGVAIADVGGVPTVFATNGVWQIHGDGPDANGVGSFFPARRLPFEVGCIDPLICRTSVGIMFRGKRGFYLLAEQLIPIGMPIDPNTRSQGANGYAYARVVFDEAHNEIRVVDAELGRHWVYNTLEKKWSEWTQDADAQNFVDIVNCQGRVWYLHKDASDAVSIRREYGVDESGYNTSTEAWSITTPWIRLDGVAGYGRVWGQWLTVKTSANASNVSTLVATLETRSSAQQSGTDTFSWTGAELSAQGGDGDSVALRMPPSHQLAKAFRVTVAETQTSAYAGSKPVSLRLELGVDGKSIRRLKSGAQKGAA